MCFIEFVGYTCGHTSLPVLRACPLTTASHTFPACTRRADKPFFAGEMCSACQKIVHSRATQIEEYEHRFMHLRGACSCETVFPFLIRPRQIGVCGEKNDKNGRIHDHDEYNEALKDPVPPILCESKGKLSVSVRLPSLFAAEWVGDHRRRHEDGQCDCRVDFRPYEERLRADEEEKAARAHAMAITDNTVCNIGSKRLRRVASMSAMSSIDDSDCFEQEGLKPQLERKRSSSHQEFTYFVTEDVAEGTGEGDGFVTATSALKLKDGEDGHTAPGLVPNSAFARMPPRPGKSVRFAGAVFEEVPQYLRLVGQFLAQPSPALQNPHQPVMIDCVLDETADELAMVAYKNQNSPNQPRPLTMTEIKEHHERQARLQVPLVGFPIGAGPEGMSHAIPWETNPPCWRRN